MDKSDVCAATPKSPAGLTRSAFPRRPFASAGTAIWRTVLATTLLLGLTTARVVAGTPAGFWDDDELNYSPWRSIHDGQGHFYLVANILGTTAQNVAGGQQVGRLVRLDEATGAVDASFQWDEQLGSPLAVAVQTDGKILVAVNSGLRDGARVVRVNASGSYDPSFVSPVFASPARFISLQPDGKMLLVTEASVFSTTGTITNPGTGAALYRLMPDGSMDGSFTVVSSDGAFFTPPIPDALGRIYLAGSFSTVSGSARHAIVRLSADGVLDPAFAAPAGLPAGFASNSTGRGVRVQSDSRVVLIGRFSYTGHGNINTDPVVAIRFNADGSFDNSFVQPLRSVTLSGISTFDYPRALTPADNDGFYVGSDRLQRFNADGSLDSSFPAIIYNEPVYWLSRSPTTGNLFVPNLSSVPGNIASYTAAGVVIPGFNAGGWGTTQTPLSAITLNDGRLLVTGQFDHYNAQAVPGAVLFDSGAAPINSATAFLDPAIVLANPTVKAFRWADGSFGIMQSADGDALTDPSAGIARYLADGSADPAWAPAIASPASWNYEPTADGGLIAWQSLPTYEQMVANGTAAYLQKYLANGSRDASFAQNLGALVSITRDGNNTATQILAGQLQRVRALPDGSTLLCLADTTGFVTVRKILASGQLDSSYSAVSLGATASSSGYSNPILNPTLGQYFQAAVTSFTTDMVGDLLGLSDGRAYVTGSLAVAGQPSGLVRLLANGSLDPSFTGTGLAYSNALNLAGAGTTLAADSLGRVYLAGRFTSVNGTAAKGLARFTAAGAFDTSWVPGIEVRDNLLLGTVLAAGNGWLNILGNGALPADALTTGFLRVALPDTVLPVITGQPAGQTANAGTNVTFTITATGASSYQWYKDGAPIPLATNSSLTLTGVGAVDAGSYTVAVGNATGTVISNGATLAVTSGYNLYVQTYFSPGEQADPAVSGPNAVYGADGLTNLVKYALGLNPKVDATTGLPVASTTATDWVYTYGRPTDRSDLIYTVETSSDLTNWSTNGVTHELVSTSGATQTWQARVPLAGNATIFFRLKVVTP